MHATDHQGRVLTLPDGRNLGYAEFGDPNGAPCLYFHFTPGSRLEPVALFSGTRRTWLQGIRLIGVDRPGFGLSDPQPGRTLLDWPDDITALADHLGIERFAVLGASGGGGYALACAYALPQRLTAALVVSGLGPLDRPDAKAGMAWMNRLLYGLSGRAPLLLQALSWAMFRALLAVPAAQAGGYLLTERSCLTRNRLYANARLHDRSRRPTGPCRRLGRGPAAGHPRPRPGHRPPHPTMGISPGGHHHAGAPVARPARHERACSPCPLPGRIDPQLSSGVCRR
jgi:pimeloyl-ACP methyl ester carboxylesterase